MTRFWFKISLQRFFVWFHCCFFPLQMLPAKLRLRRVQPFIFWFCFCFANYMLNACSEQSHLDRLYFDIVMLFQWWKKQWISPCLETILLYCSNGSSWQCMFGALCWAHIRTALGWKSHEMKLEMSWIVFLIMFQNFASDSAGALASDNSQVW